ncbi:hypothetical protein [Micromonospora sp. HM5-17]|uniref:hypothetical protein n=1 Tax=Micromonospora sp. HM5-17 TaxID=2487710 RepID=UPI001F16C74C|nr:hypothetical protein [Micromonospora sp. HM5-17]
MTSIPGDTPVDHDAPVDRDDPVVRRPVADTDVLARRVEAYLTVARIALRGAELELAERLGAALRRLVADTTAASAVDRARVRAAVHALVLRREPHGRVLPRRSLTAAQQVINQVLRQLGRSDLVVLSRPEPEESDRPVDSPCAVC